MVLPLPDTSWYGHGCGGILIALRGWSSVAKLNYEAARNIGIKIYNIKCNQDINNLKNSVLKSDMVLDAIFGTGLTRSIEGIYAAAINTINENKKFTLSIDVPSGMDSDTGNILSNCIEADLTVTFQLYKKGFLNYGARKYTGEVILEEIVNSCCCSRKIS